VVRTLEQRWEERVRNSGSWPKHDVAPGAPFAAATRERERIAALAQDLRRCGGPRLLRRKTARTSCVW